MIAGSSSVSRSNSLTVEWCRPSRWAISLPLDTTSSSSRRLPVERPRQRHQQRLIVLRGDPASGLDLAIRPHHHLAGAALPDLQHLDAVTDVQHP